MNTRQIEDAIMKAAIFEMALWIAITIIMFLLTYWVIKAGVRDGIKEASGNSRTPPDRRTAPAGYEWKLVKSQAHEEIRID